MRREPRTTREDWFNAERRQQKAFPAFWYSSGAARPPGAHGFRHRLATISGNVPRYAYAKICRDERNCVSAITDDERTAAYGSARGDERYRTGSPAISPPSRPRRAPSRTSG